MQTRANEVIGLKEEEIAGRYSGSMSIRDTLGAMEEDEVRASYASIVGEEAPADRDELLDKLAAHMQGLNAA